MRVTIPASRWCMSDHCSAPVACRAFGHCRERHFLAPDDPAFIAAPAWSDPSTALTHPEDVFALLSKFNKSA